MVKHIQRRRPWCASMNNTIFSKRDIRFFKLLVGPGYKILVLGIIVGGISLANRVSANETPSCYQNPFVLACFKPYKTELRAKHLKQLNTVADHIVGSMKWKQPDNYISVVGHAATYGNNTDFDANARARAHNTAVTLEGLIQEKGGVRFTIKEISLGDSEPRVMNSTQKGRSLNRRVEIVLSGLEPVVNREDALNELCELSNKSSRLVSTEIDSRCDSIKQATKMCKDYIDLIPGEKLRGAACQPYELFCVVCK